MIAFENWAYDAFNFFEARRLEPFRKDRIKDEARFTRLIDRQRKQLEFLVSGEHLQLPTYLYEQFRPLVGRSRYPKFQQIKELLDLEDDERTRNFRELFEWADDTKGVINDFVGDQFIAKRLLQHPTLLLEQRLMHEYINRLNKGNESPPVSDAIKHFFEVPDPNQPNGLEKVYVQEIKHAWARMWHALVNHVDNKKWPVDYQEWNWWYANVEMIVSNEEICNMAQPYLWELAQNSFYFAPTLGVERFMAGILYGILLARWGAEPFKKEIEKELSEIVKKGKVFTHDSYRRFDYFKKAGYFFFVDPEAHFIFKHTTKQEAELIHSIRQIVENPFTTYYRFVAFLYDVTNPEEMGALLHERIAAVKSDPKLKEFFDLPCVQPWQMVIEDGDKKIITMHNMGKTIAEQLSTWKDKENRELLCKRVLDMIKKFHFIMSEHVVKVDDEFYVTQNPLHYEEAPKIPVFDYVAETKRRVVGAKQDQRLGESKLYDLVEKEIKNIAEFLNRSCVGVIIRDTDDTNFTNHGILDLEKVCVGNFMYDVARFIYSMSWQLKENVDRRMLRDYAINNFIELVKHSSLSEKHRKILQCRNDHDCFDTYNDVVQMIYDDFSKSSREQCPAASDEIIQATTWRSITGVLLEYDCCRTDAKERMINYCQAAAIIATMGEVGTLTKRMYEIDPKYEEHQQARTELGYAVQTSIALMKYQGFDEMAVYWTEYSRESGKIPKEFLVDNPGLLRNAFISGLRSIMMQRTSKPRSRIYVPQEPRIIVP